TDRRPEPFLSFRGSIQQFQPRPRTPRNSRRTAGEESPPMPPHPPMRTQTGRHGVVSRRTFLRGVAAGTAGLGLLGWKDAVTLRADELRRRGLACILLFMRGGPSQLETFDPKPGTDHGGPTRAVATAAAGIQVAEHWPGVARAMKDIAIIRSMTNTEAEH